MQKILFLMGLPASGKSTFAKQYCLDNPNFKRLNKDELRIELGNEPYSREFEDKVLTTQRERGLQYLKDGFSIIVDDTNFSPKHRNYWSQIASEHSCEFDIKIFPTSVTECIRRDEKRENSVGREVIINMYQNMVVKGVLPVNLDNYMYLLRTEEKMKQIYDLYDEINKEENFDVSLDTIGEMFLCRMGYYGI